MSVPDIKTEAAKILGNPERIQLFATSIGVEGETAQKLLSVLTEKPIIPREKIEEYIFNSGNVELKAFYSGQQDGYDKGHDAGFGKGAAVGVLATVGAALLLALANNKSSE